MRRYFVTGGAGFIGSHLVDRLIAQGHDVTAYDNLSTGFPEFLDGASQSRRFHLIKGDALDEDALTEAMAGCDFVYHLAANADVRFGLQHPRKDLEQNTIATFNVLEAMRANGIGKIAFASTGSIYGEPEEFPSSEVAPFPVQTSLYGASKLACEGLIQAYCEGYDMQAWIFRFVSVLGERYTHGHVIDFFSSLTRNPTKLHVLGDGRQRKSYMYVHDCLDAMLLAVDKAQEKVNILNLGLEDMSEVNDSVRWISAYLGISPEVTYEGGRRGWIGDSPRIHLDVERIRSLGWQPRLSIREGVLRTLQWIEDNPWVLARSDRGEDR